MYGETIILTPEEADLFLRTLDGIVAFAKDYPLEFQAFCNPEKFQGVIDVIAKAEGALRAQITSGTRERRIESDAVGALLDLEECVTGARDARLANARIALFTVVGGGIAASLLGLSALSTIGGITAIGILILGPFGRAATAPQEVVSPG